jgi:hypothetical protein
MQVGDHIIQLLLGEAVAHGRHHVAAADDGLLHKPVIGHQAARKILFLEYAFQGGTLERFGVVGTVTDRAVKLIDTPALRLLGVQPQFGIGFQGRIFLATGESQQDRKAQRNGRYPLQMTIMFCSAAF